MPNNAICSGSGTGVGVPPDDPPELLVPPVLPPELLVVPPEEDDDVPHLPNQHHQVACAGAGTAAPIRPAVAVASNILLIFIIVTPFAERKNRFETTRLFFRRLCANFAG